MSLGTANRDGGKTSESGHLRAIMKDVVGEVLSGLAVSQRGAGANMSVDIAIGDVIVPRSDATYGHPAFNDAVLNQVIATADPSNPRRDILVIYIDYANAVSTGVSNNTNGVVKVKVVAGTPAGSPADPTDSAIQSSVGASNPFSKLARIRVGAGVTSIGNSVIDDLRTMATAVNNGGWNALSSAWDYWAYASASTITVPTDATTIHQAGQFVRFWQTTGGWKYGQITTVAATLLTITLATGQTLANERIYLPAYSYDHRPFGLPSSLPNGQVVQIKATTFGLLAAQTSTIPYDDTPPQITEGFEVMTQVITPTASTNNLLVEVDVYGSCSALGELIAALFQDTTANALAADSTTIAAAGYLGNVKLRVVIPAGTTSPTTLRVRIGNASNNNTAFNGFTTSGVSGAATRAFNTTPKSSIKVTEIRA